MDEFGVIVETKEVAAAHVPDQRETSGDVMSDGSVATVRG